MTLSDALVERYSRQILLSEVGGRGQERLCAARAVVSGDEAVADVAADLLAAAGVGVTRVGGAPGMLAIELGGHDAVVARLHGKVAVIATLTGRPCARCVPDDVAATPPRAADDAATAQAAGALAAGEAMRLILRLATSGHVQRMNLADGTFDGRPIPLGPGCARCAEAS